MTSALVTGGPEPYLGVHAINIYVRDQERSLRFYLDTLGFQIAFDGRRESGERLLAVTPPDGTAVLALIQPEPGSPQYQLIGRSTQVVLVTEDVPARYREWRSRGVRFRNTPRLRRVVYHRAGSPAHDVSDPSHAPDTHCPPGAACSHASRISTGIASSW